MENLFDGAKPALNFDTTPDEQKTGKEHFENYHEKCTVSMNKTGHYMQVKDDGGVIATCDDIQLVKSGKSVEFLELFCSDIIKEKDQHFSFARPEN